MAEQIPFSIVENVLSSLGSSVVQKLGSMYGVRNELEKLEEKLGTLNAVLLDAEDQLEKSHAVTDWVKRLKRVVYAVDDLLDDFATYQLRRGGPARKELRLRNVRAEVLRQLMLASSSLKHLYICGIDGEIFVPEEQLQPLSTLESLYISNCSGLEALLQCWRSSPSSLRALAICRCPELTSLPKEIYSLKKLETLYLSGFQLTDEDRAKIARLPDVNLTTDDLADLELIRIFFED